MYHSYLNHYETPFVFSTLAGRPVVRSRSGIVQLRVPLVYSGGVPRAKATLTDHRPVFTFMTEKTFERNHKGA